jgi:hypothetical protein
MVMTLMTLSVGERTEFGVLEKRMQRIMSEGKRKEQRNEKST